LILEKELDVQFVQCTNIYLGRHMRSVKYDKACLIVRS